MLLGDALMADTKPANNKHRSRRRLLLSLLAVIAALAVMTMPKPAAPEYQRYVGPPLPDGSRVTFLHPASVSRFLCSPNSKPTQPWIVQQVVLMNPRMISREEAIWYRLPFASRVPARDAGVGVMVTNISKTYLTKRLIVSGRSERQYVEGTDRNYGDAYVDEVDFVNAPRGLMYAFQYYSLNNSQSSVFAAHKAAIINSFQVLPPDAAPPVP